MRVKEVPLLEDNYGYLLIGEDGACAAIDPVEPEKILKAAEEEGVVISKVLTTHKHWDHAGGNSALLKLRPGIEVLGGEVDRVEACTHTLQDGDEFDIGSSLHVRCLHTPGHTMGHTCYYVTSGEEKVVFTGDTLFVGGAGKFFEGSPADMYESLYTKLGSLPEETKVYCGHEYTLSNYKFAAHIDPENQRLLERVAWAKQQRNQGNPTIPSTIKIEKDTNPFMRVQDQAIQANCKLSSGASPVEVLGRVREMKNNFR